MKRLAAIMCLACCTSAHASPRQKLIDSVTAQAREARMVLDALRVAHDADPGYLLIQDARFHALSDLDGFQGHDPLITEERLRNDLYELRMDLHEYVDGLPAVAEVEGRP